MSRGNPLADFPCVAHAPKIPPPASSDMTMYGFPAMVTGSAFCAPMLPSSQVSLPMTR